MSAWMSEKPTTKSGCELEDLADLRAGEGADLRLLAARLRGRTVKPLMPTMRSCSPSAYSDFGGFFGEADDAPWTHRGKAHGYSIRFVHAPSASRSCSQRSCRRKLAPYQNSTARGTTRNPVQRGGRGTSRPSNSASNRASRASKVSRASSVSDCCEAQAPSWLTRGRAGEIGVGFGLRHQFDVALDPHLHAVAHARPVEQQRRLRIGLQFAALAAVEVAVEHEAGGIERLQQDDARGRTPAAADRGHGHRGAVGLAGSGGLVEEGLEGGEDVVGHGMHARIVARTGAARTPTRPRS